MPQLWAPRPPLQCTSSWWGQPVRELAASSGWPSAGADAGSLGAALADLLAVEGDAEKEGTGEHKMTPPVEERLAGPASPVQHIDLESLMRCLVEGRTERPLPWRLQSAAYSWQDRREKSGRARAATDEAKKAAAATEAAAAFGSGRFQGPR